LQLVEDKTQLYLNWKGFVLCTGFNLF